MEKLGTILVIDDAEDILLSLKILLKQNFKSVFTESNPFHVPRLLRQIEPDVVLLDMNFGKGRDDGAEGLHWLKKIKELRPEVSVVMMTAYSDVSLAVEALKSGASDFVEKPWRNEKLVATLHAVYDLSLTQKKLHRLESTQRVLTDAMDQTGGELHGESDVMQDVHRTISKVAGTEANVLILGENGTGKELVARELYRKSGRSDRVFIPVDMGAIPDSLFESEVFGHAKGSFTGAHQDRVGRFEAAEGGTLFLDEIGNMSLPAQSKLLQALQRRTITPVGSNKAIEIDIRLVCATNMPLYDMVEEGTFRQDLLYRINTVEISLPPLSHRQGDISLLAIRFLKLYARKYNKPLLKINADALELLETYHWPGNVRELRHIIERAVIMSEDDIIGSGDIVLHSGRQSSIDIDTTNLTLEEMEIQFVTRALAKHKGNISKTDA
jgi:DNA-binding NtrC family response regulator